MNGFDEDLWSQFCNDEIRILCRSDEDVVLIRDVLKSIAPQMSTKWVRVKDRHIYPYVGSDILNNEFFMVAGAARSITADEFVSQLYPSDGAFTIPTDLEDVL